MELVEQHALPALGEAARILAPAAGQHGHGAERLAVVQMVLAVAVGLLDAALRGVAAGEDEVVFVRLDGQQRLMLCQPVKELAHPAEEDLGHQRPGLHIQDPLDIAPGRAAAVVAHAVDLHGGIGVVLRAPARQERGHVVGDRAEIPARLAADQNLVARGRAPAVGALAVVAAAVIVVADAALPQQLRDGRGVAEGIRLKIERERVRRKIQQSGQILPAVEQVPEHGFGPGHVLVVLDPGGGRDLPAALADAAADGLQHGRRVFLDDLIRGRLRLGVDVVRVLLHEIEHGLEGVDDDADGLVRAPLPVHVDVGVRGADEVQLLCPRRVGRERLFGLQHHAARQRAGPAEIGRQRFDGGNIICRQRLARGGKELLQIRELGQDPLGAGAEGLAFQQTEIFVRLIHMFIPLRCLPAR